MKAIETTYDNHRFRSRLEARYAVFFKALGLPYQYEPEGFELNGKCYLPDFLLPTIPLWVEIKGQKPTEEEEQVMCDLVKHTGIYGTILGPFENYVLPNVYDGCYSEDYFHQIYAPSGGDHPYMFCECLYCRAIGYEFDGRSARIRCCDKNKKSSSDKDYSSDSPRLIHAYRKAMQARFEHGEHG